MKQTTSTRESVYQEIRTRIINLTFLPGMALSETELAAQLNVSRTPVREALVLLDKDGLIEVFPRKGTFVTKINLDLVRETQFVREAIEIASLRSIPADLDPELLNEIRDNLAQQELAAKSHDSHAFFTLDEVFHASLMKLANHRRSWDVIATTKPHLDRARYLGYQESTPPISFYEQHCEIFDRICAKDLGKAEELLSNHLRTVFDDTKIAQKILPEFFTSEEAPSGDLNGRFPAAMASSQQSVQELLTLRMKHQPHQ
ncbi:GntR family transcriptional regulator [Arcanobacterium bovis]|uniref:GntR family transcriptional regulator n=1 Tax=Arcanobacterium bovis TaxID=2529275 RepID=A0A4Q9V217_9ACTO|nr:GntR family transcriptional regulator [Arcanobacterium bovis]TBW22170.1 GntR family transcriptional regulator [Arcanobacterium bovis]